MGVSLVLLEQQQTHTHGQRMASRRRGISPQAPGHGSSMTSTLAPASSVVTSSGTMISALARARLAS
jgi:hypothetical protein